MTLKSKLISLALGVFVTLSPAAFSQTSRTVMVQSNSGVLLFPTNLWSANASAARSGLSLANHATNPIVPLTSGGSGATNAGGARTNLGLGATNNVTFANVTTEQLIYGTNGIISLANQELYDAGGQAVLSWTASEFVFETYISFNSDSNKAITRTNLGLGATWLTNNNVTNFRTAIGLGATNEVAFDVVNTASGLRVFSGTNVVVYIGEDTSEFETPLYVGGALGVIFSTNNSGAAATRTNLGLGATWLTNTTVTNFRTAIGLGGTDRVTFANLFATTGGNDIFNISFGQTNTGFKPVGGDTNDFGYYRSGSLIWHAAAGNHLNVRNGIVFFAGADSVTRTNLGLGATWLTNNNVTNFRTAIGLGATNSVTFDQVVTPDLGADSLTIEGAIYFTQALTNLGVTRSNLGIPWTGLTNINAATFQGALFAATNAAPTTTTNVAAWINLQVGTNTYKLPLYQ